MHMDMTHAILCSAGPQALMPPLLLRWTEQLLHDRANKHVAGAAGSIIVTLRK